MRKDFPQRLGVLLVGIGIVGSSIAWYNANLAWTFGILFAGAGRLATVHVRRQRPDVLPLQRAVPRHRRIKPTKGSLIWRRTKKYRLNRGADATQICFFSQIPMKETTADFADCSDEKGEE